MAKTAPPKTLDEFLNSLERQDMTLAAWARSKGLPVRAVWSVASGQHTGRHGRARQILRAMGVEPPPIHRADAKAARAAA